MASETLWWLERRGGGRVAITAAGILVGRSAGCDIILSEPHASRRHAIVYLAGGAPRLVPMGSAPCIVDGTAVAIPRELSTSSTVELGGEGFCVRSETRALGRESSWILHAGGGSLFGLSRHVHSVGGGGGDDLVFDGLPPRALTFYSGPGRIAVEFGAPGGGVNGEAKSAGDVVELQRGDRIQCSAVSLRVATGGMIDDVTTRAGAGEGGAALGASEVQLEFLPRGGRATVSMGGALSSIYLAGLRCDLLASLIRPPSTGVAGELVDDERLIAAIWPGKAMGRADLNTLVYRLRRDLLRGGVDGFGLVEREAGGVRLRLAAGARVDII